MGQRKETHPLEGLGMLYITETHSISFSDGLELTTNKFIELMELKITLHLAKERDISRLHINGDLQLITNCMNGVYTLQKISKAGSREGAITVIRLMKI